MTDFYTKYVALCANKKKSLSAVAEEVGLSRTSPNGWKKGKVPSDVNIQKLADYFNVSVQYLRGSEQESENPTAQTGSEADPVTMELLSMVNNATDDERQVMLEMLRLLKAQRGKG